MMNALASVILMVGAGIVGAAIVVLYQLPEFEDVQFIDYIGATIWLAIGGALIFAAIEVVKHGTDREVG